jgi:hypothetical protein
MKGSTLLWLVIGGVVLYYVAGYMKFSKEGLFGPGGLQLDFSGPLPQPIGTVGY